MNLKSFTVIAGFGIGLTGGLGCGGAHASAQPTTTSAVLPAASGTQAEGDVGMPTVSARVMPLDPTALKTALFLTASNLEPPSKLAPDARVYVVWMKPPDGGLENIGALTVRDDGSATLDALAPFGNFDILLTPEASPRATRPTNGAVRFYYSSAEGPK